MGEREQIRRRGEIALAGQMADRDWSRYLDCGGGFWVNRPGCRRQDRDAV